MLPRLLEKAILYREVGVDAYVRKQLDGVLDTAVDRRSQGSISWVPRRAEGRDLNTINAVWDASERLGQAQPRVVGLEVLVVEVLVLHVDKPALDRHDRRVGLRHATVLEHVL